MHRFFLNNEGLGNPEITVFDEDFVFQVFKVLRFRISEELVLFNDDGKNYYYEILELNKKSVRLGLKKIEENLQVSKRKVRLFFSMTKQMEKVEFVLQKCTEIGVSEFFPLISQRTERRILEKRDRLCRILKEATEQSGGSQIPILHEERSLKEEFLADREGFVPVFAHLSGEKIDFGNFLDFSKIDLFIGPEGGFSEDEMIEAKKSGFYCLKFSERTFRAETASVAISSLFLLNNNS
ncbi:MAG: RsmE family RNA methyltransferase [Candidatus Gracilibacteria bacterium]|jgi:16S rRNA (uracil1498-N3)-methyltransferase|nr:RsmE family RNA methyltransferase [Candidatus Gracilibacteria bacterium]